MRDDRTVEAGSLADLNLLAANPPRYPVNPTEEPREPLTLYISRVPGTRDIILSTLKPQRKNVTGEDIANALYYVHLDLPSDGLLVAPPTMPAATSATAQSSPTTPTVSRKPVPSTAPRQGPVPADTSLPPGPPTGPPQSSTFPPTGPTGPAPPVGGYPSGPPPSYNAATQPPSAPPPAQRPTSLPAQPPAPPPHREPVSPRQQPWVPPGFRLEERQTSFERAVMSSLDNLPSQQGQTQQQPQQQPRPQSVQQPPTTSTLPIRSRPLPGRTLPSNANNNGNNSSSNNNSNSSNAVQPPPAVAPAPGGGIPRKPVGPRPDGAVDTNAPLFPPRPQDKALPQQPQQAQQAQQPRALGLTSTQPTPNNFVPFQLTLIRRDPSSNHQWNIGKVASVQPVDLFEDGDDEEATPAVSEQPSIRIHLETSGYAKFRGDDGGKAFARQVVMAYTKSWTAGIRNAFKRPSANSHERSSSLDGAQPATQGFAAPGVYPPDNSDLEPPRRFLRPRNNSLASTTDSALGGLGGLGVPDGHAPRRKSKELSRSTSPPLITRPGPGLKPKGYTFSSPWDGRCDFRTGNGGRSLKCRHILHPATDATTGATGGGVAGYNPLVIAQSFRDGPGQGLAAVAAATSSVVTGQSEGGGGGGRARAGSLTSALTGAVVVSELRFNLPHGDLIRKRDNSEEQERERDKTRSDQLYGRFQDHLHHLQHHARRRGSSTEEDDYPEDEEEEELDLSLGREKAGGGNRGKRAKLGKLIVYDDGFKMLDLVVAANMGVWWVTWERSF